MNRECSVSVIIPVFNGSLLINRCLDSIFRQTGGFTLEVIVINDGSTDDSPDLVLNYSHPVKLLQQTNLGPASARNKGIEDATGRYLAFLDADDYWEPCFLEETVRFLEEHSDAVAVSVGQLHKIPGKADTVVPEILRTNPQRLTNAILLPAFYEFWAVHNHVCTGSVLMRTNIIKQTGGQRLELRITEDLEFWAYLATFGCWGFIPKVLFVSDGGKVTRQTGWINKNIKRWATAPAVEEWEKRIVKRIGDPLPDGYLRARGRIAGNLAYSMILSSRDDLARQTIIRYRQSLQNNNLTLLLKMAASSGPLWKITCILIRFRESRRNLFSVPAHS